MKLTNFIDNERDRIWDEGTKHQNDSIQRAKRLIDFVGDIEVNAITVKQIHQFLDKLKTDGLSVATLDRYGATISSILKHAKRTEEIRKIPDFVWKKQDSNARVRFFSDEEREKLITFFKYSEAPWMADMVILSLNTGMRHGEIISVIKGDFGFRNDLNTGRPCLYLPKTKNGDARWVPLNQNALEAATKLHNSNCYNHHVFYKLWSEARSKIARGDKQFVFHVCRHTCATMMANKLQTNTIVMMDMLGHRNHKTTQKYVHGVSETRFSIADQMDKLN